MKKVIAFTIALGIIALCYCAAAAATNDYIWSQKPASGPLVSRNLTPTVGRIIGFPTSINSPETIIIGSGLTLTGSTLTASGGAVSTLTDVTLTSIASGDFLKWNGTAWINRTAVNARTDLGLGTMATQASSSVAITGGTISGITSLTIANTGTVNATSAASLRLPNAAIGASSALSLVSVANGGSGYEVHFGDKDGVDRTLMTLDYAQTPTNKTISGATNTITDLNASNLASGTVDAARMPALTGDVTTSAGAVATTLATVNSNVGSFTNASITVNAKGLVTAASSGSGGATLATNTFTGAQIISVAGAASTPALSVTGAAYSGGSATTTKPLFLIETAGATSNNWGTLGSMLGVNAPSSLSTAALLIDLQRDGTRYFSVNGTGATTIVGALSASAYTNNASGWIGWNGRGYFYAGADGVFRMLNNAETGFGRLIWGPATTSFAAIKANGPILQVRLGDDSAYATIDAKIILQTAAAPASASDTGTAGEVRWDASYLYICTATNTWKRVAIATW